jgi:hypothetical protein
MLPSVEMRNATRRSFLGVVGTVVGSALVTFGCGSSSTPALLGDGSSAALPSADDLQAFSRLTNAIPAEVEVDGATNYGVIDTGNPWALLDPAAFPAASSLSTNGGTLDAITTGGKTIDKPFSFGTTAGNVTVGSGFTLHGNLGCSVLCGQVASFDYRAVSFVLGGSSPPSDVAAPVSIDFALSGGGTTDGIVLPPSRLVVPVTIEGATLMMIVDTGATDITISASAYGAIVADGRTQIDGGMSQTTSGTSDSSITRVASAIVGGVKVDRPVVAHDSSFDANLADVSSDVGTTIDGSLGGTFLRNFFVTVDYPSQTMDLAAYPDLSFTIDQGEMVGVLLAIDTTGAYRVSQVSATAAALGVTVGDTVTAIDGQDLSTVSHLQIATFLYGHMGATKTFSFSTAASLSNQNIAVPVEEMLPLPVKM